jgi:hypothetical protein
MDNKNRFHTSGTWFLVRAEHITLMIVLSILIAMHAAVVNWGRFIFAFVIIDLIGYLPGAIAYRRARGGPIAPIYHHLYNFAHSYLTAAVAVGLWAFATGGFEWAMLSIPIHYSGDRGLFGNTYKPAALSFEPVASTNPIGILGTTNVGESL